MQKLVQSDKLPFWIYWRMFNYWPAIRGSGVRVTHVARDWTELRVRLKLNWRTRNYVGTIFGGSLYAAVDPFYMVMILRQIGDDYVVWDKSARISFKRPGDRTLYGVFEMPAEEVASLRAVVDEHNQTERTYSIDLKDSDGRVYATIDKLLYVARKDWFKARQHRRAARAATPTGD
jgi:acyl-coenzyme A thioesterase PaaI-like protein